MPQLIQASDLSLREVKERFNLQQVGDSQFFQEWQAHLPEIPEAEKQWLDQIKADFLSLAEESLHEEVVKLFVLAPLLSLAGLARSPFLPVAEKPVEIAFEDEDEIVRGRIDLMVFHRRLWAIVIESKRKKLNVIEALPQALFYMMSSPNEEQPVYGFTLNGTEFLFIKLVKQNLPQYALSRLL